MEAILISDYAKWCALMMNGIKNIEVRKNKALAIAIQKLINKYGYAEIYVYCTKGKPNLWLPYEYDCFELDETSQPYLSDKPILDVDTKMNGKVIFKFRCYKVSEWHNYSWQKITKNACLTDDELRDYSKGVASLYCIHISQLEIFDKPKELSEFKQCKEKKCPYSLPCHKTCHSLKSLTKAPQNYCYVEGV